MMYGRGKSDFAIVAVKPANKADHSAEHLRWRQLQRSRWSEGRRPRGECGPAKHVSTCRTQSRASVSQALERARQTFAVMTRGRSR